MKSVYSLSLLLAGLCAAAPVVHDGEEKLEPEAWKSLSKVIDGEEKLEPDVLKFLFKLIDDLEPEGWKFLLSKVKDGEEKRESEGLVSVLPVDLPEDIPWPTGGVWDESEAGLVLPVSTGLSAVISAGITGTAGGSDAPSATAAPTS